MISLGFTGTGTFDVQNYRGSCIDFFRRNVITGLDQNLVVSIAERVDKWENIPLSKRLAAGYLNQIAAKFFELRQDIIETDLLAAVKSVFTVAPNAPHRATREPHERTRPPGVRRLALNRKKDFGYSQFHINSNRMHRILF